MPSVAISRDAAGDHIEKVGIGCRAAFGSLARQEVTKNLPAVGGFARRARAQREVAPKNPAADCGTNQNVEAARR
jgi:hypothetical protein